MLFTKKFGFGCMRLPMKGEQVDLEQFSKMIDAFMAAGFNYFDTAHGYINGKSELAIKECLCKRYKREDFVLTNKLSNNFFKTQDDIEKILDAQLEACGTRYFDYYLMHAQNARYFEKYKKCRAYETAFELKKSGKIRHVGISFHDSPKVLEQILKEYPQIEVVQIQFNYLDHDNPSVESMECYQVCLKHNKPMIVMEPVKGGSLADVPDEAKKIFAALSNDSPALYALRYAASFKGIEMVISGMSDFCQMQENLDCFANFRPLDGAEYAAVERVAEIIKAQELVPCTGCRYCVEVCPQKLPIPDIFECYNSTRKGLDERKKYAEITRNTKKPSECIGCARCEWACPQFMDVRKYIKNSAELFE